MKLLYIKKLKLILFIFLLGLNPSSSAEVTKLTLIDTNGVEQAMSDYIGQQYMGFGKRLEPDLFFLCARAT